MAHPSGSVNPANGLIAVLAPARKGHGRQGIVFFFTPRRAPVKRCVAILAAFALLWSFVLATPAQALAQAAQQPHKRLGVRTLSEAEMQKMIGRTIFHNTATTTTPMSSGGSMPWQGGGGGFNAETGNKLTSFPIVGWTQRGGMPIALVLNHNTNSSHDSELGQKFTHSYDIFMLNLSGSDLTIHWGDDQAYTFTHNIDGTFSPPAGIHDSLVKNIDNTYTLTRPDQTAYHFTTGLYCDTISDENGNTVTLGYNSGNFVTSITDATGRAITLTVVGGEITTITVPLSRTWSLSYNGSNELTTITYPIINSTYYTTNLTFSGSHNITDIQDRRGNHWGFTYSSNALASETDPCSNTTNYSYTASTTTVTDPNGHAVVYTFSSGKLASVENAASQTESYTWDADNNRTQIVDKRGYDWNFTFDARGNTLTSANPYSNTVTNTFNAHNKLLTKTIPTGEETVYTRDGNDNVTEIDFKDLFGTTQASVTYTIGSHGLVSDYYDENTHHTQYGYSSNGDLTSVITPLSKETDFTTDGLGVRTGRTDALTRATSYSLDAWERTTTVTYPDTSTHTFTFDAENHCTQFVDATGTTNRTFDTSGRICPPKRLEARPRRVIRMTEPDRRGCSPR